MAPEQELRICFSGPPRDVLEELFHCLVSDEGRLSVQVGESTVQLPVFLLDSNAQDPGHSRSAHCTSNHLVKVRTSDCPVLLALLPPDEASKLSIKTTVSHIGIVKPVDDFNSWTENPFVGDLVAEGLSRLFSEELVLVKARAALDRALKEAWVLDERFRDKRNTWSTLRRIFETEITESAAHEAFSAILGLPSCSLDEFGSDEHLSILSRVAEVVEHSGLTAAFENFEEQEDGELEPHVVELKRHIFSQCSTSPEFSLTPMRRYTPVKPFVLSELPAWWQALSIDAWNRLLESPAEEKLQTGLLVDCAAPLAPYVRGMPILMDSQIAVDIDVAAEVEAVPVTISKASGGRTLETIETVQIRPGEPVNWQDNSVPLHKTHVRYRFEADGFKPVNLKFIVLDQYAPGIAVYSRGATKITPFKLNKKARDAEGRKIERYECTLNLHGMGAHQLDLYTGSTVAVGETIAGFDINSEHDDGAPRPITRTNDRHAVCVIETDQECHYDFQATPADETEQRPYRVWIEADDQSPTGATSEFDRLIIEHRASAQGEHANARVEAATSRLTDLQVWALESEDSLHPLVLGSDYLDCWSKPDWRAAPVMSRCRLLLDPRPTASEFQPPEDLLEVRRRLQSYLRPDPDQATAPVETLHLGEFMQDEEFSDAVNRYLRCYCDWLQSDFASAAWMDVVSIHREEDAGDALNPHPYAILLTPLHPLRLAWQCRAQQILKEALDEHAQCPAASMLDPCSFPDCMLLPCRTATGSVEDLGFLAISNTSDYWGVLWNKDLIHELGSSTAKTVFDYDIGILVEGLARGFSVQQVIRSVDEISRLLSAKSTLRVSIASDTTGSSSCNDGIDRWCSSSLGPDKDAWYDAGARAIHIYDRRDGSLHPEPAALASLTARTGATMRWFMDVHEAENVPADLSIMAHLGTSNPSFQVENLRSAVDPSGLSRWRVRKQLAAGGGTFIAESRVGRVPQVEGMDSLQGLLLDCVNSMESKCRDSFDSYVFAPRMHALDDAISSAQYCAVSSSTIDPACFFRGTDQSYLWDYELPSYSRRAGENSGFYLLARESAGMVQAVQSAVSWIPSSSSLEPERVSSLLQEISRRGMPTLKRLTAGGATSLGEVGMLVALRILQTEFEHDPRGAGLAPVRVGDELLNLVIPADPFRNQFEDLRAALQQRPGKRPDLIIASIRFSDGSPAGIKLTPVEVKARDSLMSQADRQSALRQASTFAEYLAEVKGQGDRLQLWGIAWRSIVASWLDYAFRVYGQLDEFLRHEKWAEIHGAVLTALMSGDLELEIDLRGRLIVIDSSNTSHPDDTDDDGFRETVVISHSDAYATLASADGSFLEAIRTSLGDWELCPGDGADSAQRAATQPPPAAPLKPVVVRAEAGKTNGGQELDVNEEAPTTQPPPRIEEKTTPSGIKVCVGSSIDVFRPKEMLFFPGSTELNQLNVGIVGDVGTGKTQLVKALIHQIRRSPEANRGDLPRVLIFDYKGDYTKPEFLAATGARVVSPFEIPLNFFDIRDCSGQRNAWLERSKFFSDILDKIYSNIGPLQRQRIKDAVRKSYDQASSSGKEAPTIYDVFDIYAGICGRQIDSPYSIMSDIVDGGYFVREPAEVLPFSAFLDDVVVIDLAAVGQDDRTKNMLVVILLNLFYEHMLKIEKRPFMGRDPQLRHVDTLLLVDEAENIMQYEFDVLKKVLLQGREFGVGVILASQYLSHFKTTHENYLQPLLTWFVHKVPSITVKELQGIGLTRVDSDTVERIKSLALHECLYKTYDVDGEFMRATPFYELINSNQ
jgi:hypothetical protein